MEQPHYEIQSNFEPLFFTAQTLMRKRGYNDVCDILQYAKTSVAEPEYDNWNGGTYRYTVYINVPIKQYSAFNKEKITEIETLLGNTLDEVKQDGNCYFIIKITPTLSREDINWENIGGLRGKIALKQKIETLRDIMISVATGTRIQDKENDYKPLQAEVVNDCRKLSLPYNNSYASLWDWYQKYKADLHTYKERRIYINQLFASTISYFEEEQQPQDMEIFVDLDDWEKVKRAVETIKNDSRIARYEEDFQKVGVLCRDVIISLAQAVYNPSIYGETDDKGIQIGTNDAVRMLGNYINVSLKGSHNKEFRTYAKATNDLTNHLTHLRSATKKEMLLTMTATIALINFIGIIENKY